MERENYAFTETVDIQKERKIERILQLWQNTFNKIFFSGLLTVLPLILAGAAVWIWIIIESDGINLVDNVLTDFFRLPLWIPICFIVLETSWVIWGIIFINRLNKDELHFLDLVKPYYEPPRRGRRKKKTYRRVLYELLPAFSVWVYLFLIVWAIAVIEGINVW